MTARFEVGDRLQKTGTELIEVAFEVLAVADVEEVGYEMAPVTRSGEKLYDEDDYTWPEWFTEDVLTEYEKI